MAETILKIKDLAIKFDIGLNIKKFPAVNNVNFELKKGNVLGIVGESGAGKSQFALSILGLNDKNATVSGEIIYNNSNLLKLTEKQLNKYRWNHIAIILQNAMSSFNPYLKIRDQLTEPLILHKGKSKEDAEKKAIEFLDLVEIPDAKNRIWFYPHEFSGGMLQRIMIAMALICNPKILIADEITSGVDATTQVQILKLLHEIQKDSEM
ncbi:MAG: ABC transporter ATP-binding protein, partial [Cytophagales bacterium]|nr:ABC transporter ATP-binding protein [Cytophagales bacterium]